MKKSTLISTLAMVVIVALALTTATFAWYTANNSITAFTTATAAIAGDADLEIKEGESGTYASTVSITALESGLRPLSIYQVAPPSESQVFSNKGQVQALLRGCFTYNNSTGKPLFKQEEVNQYGVAYAIESNLYIHNRAGLAANIDMEVTAVAKETTQDSNVTTALQEGLRVMVVKKDATGDSYTLCGIYGKSGCSYTDNFKNNAANVMSEYDKTIVTETVSEPTKLNTFAAKTTVSIGSIAAKDAVNLEVFIWYDGEKVSESQASGALTVTLTFKGTAIPVTPVTP